MAIVYASVSLRHTGHYPTERPAEDLVGVFQSVDFGRNKVYIYIGSAKRHFDIASGIVSGHLYLKKVQHDRQLFERLCTRLSRYRGHTFVEASAPLLAFGLCSSDVERIVAARQVVQPRSPI
jgi:hypothetical protein